MCVCVSVSEWVCEELKSWRFVSPLGHIYTCCGELLFLQTQHENKTKKDQVSVEF